MVYKTRRFHISAWRSGFSGPPHGANPAEIAGRAMERTPPGSLAGSRAAARQQVLAQYAPARKVFLQPPPRPGLPAVISPFSAQAQRLGQLCPGDAALGLTSTAPRPGGVLTSPLAPIVAASRLELNSMPAFETEAQRTAETEAQRTDGN